MPATLGHLRQFVMAKARKIGQGFTGPEDDWVPVAFVQHPGGVDVITLGAGMRSAMSKDFLGEFLRQRMAAGAYRYVVLLNAHMAMTPTPEQIEAHKAGELRLQDIEGSKELLILLAGDAEEEQVWTSPILLRPGTGIRVMGPWERMDDKTGWAFEGRFRGLNEYMREPPPANADG